MQGRGSVLLRATPASGPAGTAAGAAATAAATVAASAVAAAAVAAAADSAAACALASTGMEAASSRCVLFYWYDLGWERTKTRF